MITATKIDWDLCFYVKRDRTNNNWDVNAFANHSYRVPGPIRIENLKNQNELLDYIQTIIERDFGEDS